MTTIKWSKHAGTKISEFSQSLEDVPRYEGLEIREVQCSMCKVIRDKIWMVNDKVCRVCSMEATYNRNIVNGIALGTIIEEHISE